MINLEVCINADSDQTILESVKAAYNGGASRIELCSSMHVDGLTPTNKQIIKAREAFKNRKGLMVMIRPRKGDFHYSSSEIDLMIDQIKIAADNGADGVVFGCLNYKNSLIDTTTLDKLTNEAKNYNLLTTFHRAFDATSDYLKSLKTLIEYGVDKVLTSGTIWGSGHSALNGIENIQKIINASQNKIEIIVSGGITFFNVKNILDSFYFGENNISVHSYSGVQTNGFTTIEKVKSIINILNKF